MTGINRMLVKTILTSLVLFTYMSWGLPALADADELRRSFGLNSNTNRQPVLTPFPRYPTIARRDRIEGEATVCFTLDKRGNVKWPTITSSTHKIFRRPALRAIKKSTFEPLRPGQVAAKKKSCRTYRFKLDPVLADQTDE